ncbi:hypothetical protein DP113_25600 [Brasilonema octagenarum UFV-E1]|jgi:hypothetical protein|uniref:Uncharacterized protein n=2 Tax=Brasilonema TaxID=383614 RepID=A0A856ML55_9CYAN|nr:hypothetical protein [Brasilonema octagenarum UFV-OR1]QDL10844.1 hypothetical protein DP114_25690 [Brasilonema sennae CENA114]QDL17189.1 hypothetical protein DP113_25600 [Brasilonema octagenarum UFV-E1]
MLNDLNPIDLPMLKHAVGFMPISERDCSSQSKTLDSYEVAKDNIVTFRYIEHNQENPTSPK